MLTSTTAQDVLLLPRRVHMFGRTIFIDAGAMKATDFDLDKATQQMLYDNGTVVIGRRGSPAHQPLFPPMHHSDRLAFIASKRALSTYK